MPSLARITMISLMVLVPLTAQAQQVQPQDVPEFKSVYGRIEPRDRVPARARIGGTLTALNVAEGDLVERGQPLALIVDEKLQFQMQAVDGEMQALESQLANAEAELKRGENLLERGVTTAQRLDALRTSVDVLKNQIEATRAKRQVIEQQAQEGTVLAPAAGRVLDVPVTAGAVLMPGEAVATVGGGGFFLRLAIPERHARALVEGAEITIEESDMPAKGTLARIYPQIENGRVVADVTVEGLSDAFVDARVLVRVPVGTRRAIMVPQGSVITRSGLDFVPVETHGATHLRAVVLGDAQGDLVEVLTGLAPGDTLGDAAKAGAAAHE